MNAREMIGKRVLLKMTKGYRAASVEEAKILEVSPSGAWVKIMNIYGNKYWKGINEVTIVEQLEAKPEYPKEKSE